MRQHRRLLMAMVLLAASGCGVSDRDVTGTWLAPKGETFTFNKDHTALGTRTDGSTMPLHWYRTADDKFVMICRETGECFPWELDNGKLRALRKID